MDAYHLTQNCSSTDTWAKVRIIGLSGKEVLIHDSLKKIIKQASDHHVSFMYPKTMQEVFDAVSQTDVNAEPRLFIMHGGLNLVSESDALKLDRLALKNYFKTLVVLTGELPSGVSSKEFFFRNSTRYYDLDFKNTDTGRRRMELWLITVAQCHEAVAKRILQDVEYDVERAYNLAMKVLAFDNIWPNEIPLINQDFVPEKFVHHLVHLDYVEAMKMASEVTSHELFQALRAASLFLLTIGQVYPLTRQVKMPTRQQSIDSKLPMSVIQRWWHVAGRYPPEQQIRRHLLLTQMTHRYYTMSNKTGILENLVLLW